MPASTPTNASSLIDALAEAMRLLPEQEQLAIRRFYCNGEPEEVVCAALGLDVEQFRRLRQDLRTLYRRLISETHTPAPRKPAQPILDPRVWLRKTRLRRKFNK